MEARNAIIVNAGIGIDDPGMLSVYIVLDDGNGEQVFGRGVYMPKSGINGRSYAGHFIYRVLEIAGVDAWNQLKGKAVRVIGDSAHIEAIGHIIADEWFNPGKEFTQPEQEVPA
jgi:hypothetical protein